MKSGGRAVNETLLTEGAQLHQRNFRLEDVRSAMTSHRAISVTPHEPAGVSN